MKKRSVFASFASIVIAGPMLVGGCESVEQVPLPSAATEVAPAEITPSVPAGWSAFPGGGPDSLPGRCVIGVDEAMKSAGTDNLTIQCANAEPSYSGIFQTFDAVNFRNKRMRYSALMRTHEVVGSGRAEGVATLWMRVEGTNFQQPLMIARLDDRALRGTMGWTPVEIVADIPGNTVRIHIGFIMQTRGQMWITDLSFAEAPAATVTVVAVDESTLTAPRNLGLE